MTTQTATVTRRRPRINTWRHRARVRAKELRIQLAALCEPAAKRLAAVISLFVLRRLKTDPGIAPELPPKTETDHVVALSLVQAGLHEAVVREPPDLIAASDGISHRLSTTLRSAASPPGCRMAAPRSRSASVRWTASSAAMCLSSCSHRRRRAPGCP
jgi:hypothetical protein